MNKEKELSGQSSIKNRICKRLLKIFGNTSFARYEVIADVTIEETKKWMIEEIEKMSEKDLKIIGITPDEYQDIYLTRETWDNLKKGKRG